MPTKRLYIILFFISLAITGSIAAWFYVWEDMPKKLPTKAKQVLSPYSARYNDSIFAQNNIGFTLYKYGRNVLWSLK